MKMSDGLAMALADHCDGKWDAENFNETPDGTEPEVNRDYWRDLAKVAQKHVLRELIERAKADFLDAQKRREEMSGTSLSLRVDRAKATYEWLKAQMEGE